MSPKVSVIIPSYNHEKFVIRALESVENQTYGNIQIIVIDDGSGDSSNDLIENYKQSCNKEFIYFKQNNQGAHAAINRGLSLATGDYLSILNSDDEFALDRIQSCVDSSIACNNECIITSYINVIDQLGNSLGVKRGYLNMLPWEFKDLYKTFSGISDSKLNLLQSNYISTTSNLFCARNVCERVGDFRALRYAHDWDYFLRISNHFNILILEKPLLKYRLHQKNTIKEDQARMIFEICWTLADNVSNVIETILPKEGSSLDLWNRLFYSIEVFSCEKILINLLFFKYALQNHDSLKLNLRFTDFLNPNNEIHKSSINEIKKILKAPNYSGFKFIKRLKEKWKALK